jgi:hypothetical protein
MCLPKYHLKYLAGRTKIIKTKKFNMKNSKWICILGAALLIGMASCKKGDTGPAGAVGPAGPDSVSTSAWIPLNMKDTVIGSDTYFIQEIPAPALTQRILDSGLVLSYLHYVDPTAGTQVINSSELVSITYSLGNLEVVSQADWTGALDIRYVIVPGTLTVGNSIRSGPAKGLTKSDLQNMNYEDVQKALGSQASHP